MATTEGMTSAKGVAASEMMTSAEGPMVKRTAGEGAASTGTEMTSAGRMTSANGTTGDVTVRAVRGAGREGRPRKGTAGTGAISRHESELLMTGMVVIEELGGKMGMKGGKGREDIRI